MNIHLDVDWGQATLLLLLASVGLTLATVDSKLLYPVRAILMWIASIMDVGLDFINFFFLQCRYSEDYSDICKYHMEDFIKCYMCQGFWIGLLCTYFLASDYTIYSWIGYGLASSFLSILFGVLISYLKVLDFNARERS